MSNSRPSGEGNSNSAFDIGDFGGLWAWGLDTSREMSERVFEMYRDLGTSAMRVVSGDMESELRSVRLDLERVADLTIDVFDRLLAVVRRVSEDSAEAETDRDGIALRVLAGGTASAEAWVHNISAEDHAVPRLHCTDLSTAAGEQIPASRIRLDVAAAPIEAGNSRKLTLMVDVPAVCQLGVYHGLLISDASTDSAIRVRVEVLGPESADAEVPST